ncbi:MAG: CarD family transcriptional regulator, partial [Microcystaceae cyanobacterium]
MTLASIIRHLDKLPLTLELRQKLQKERSLYLSGISRVPKGLVTSSLAQGLAQNLLVITATQEEAARWAAQLELMGWATVNFYPTSGASPYEAFNQESEMIWGQMQILAGLGQNKTAIVTTEKALQPLLPPVEIFKNYCLNFQQGVSYSSKKLDETLARLGYLRVATVETEGQWSRRGDIVDIFPVSSELPVRLEWFGDDLEKLKEFDPATQRSLDSIEQLVLTPTSFNAILEQVCRAQNIDISNYLSPEEGEKFEAGICPEGMQRFLGLIFEQPVSLLDYLSPQTICVFDEVEQAEAHSDRAFELTEQDWRLLNDPDFPKIHHQFQDLLNQIKSNYLTLFLSELHDSSQKNSLNLSSRPIPTTPHQFAKLAEILRGKREIYSGITLEKYASWLISAQPSRTVSLLQEHDCAIQFIPNPKDFPAIEKFQTQRTAIALKYSGLAELEGFILPTFRLVLVTDRELFGQHALATPEYIRKRRRAASKQVDLNKLSPGDFIVHKSHGIGKFLKLESLETREYLVIQYADGILRIPVDNFDSLSRYRHTGSDQPQLHKMGSKAWEATKNKVRKAIKKLAVDLLNLYAQRAQQKGFLYPPDTPWQSELEDSFPYQATP